MKKRRLSIWMHHKICRLKEFLIIHSSCLSVKNRYVMVNDELIIIEYCIISPLLDRVDGKICLSKDHANSASVS